jgi:isopenicillin N synthase-like dioxygenase
MTSQNIPVVDLGDWHEGGAARQRFVTAACESLAGDMLQNVTNGLYKSTTHRVVNPGDAASERFSIPCFIHARLDVDLSPLPSCVARTGGSPNYPSITAGEYLEQRLREIGLA